MSAAPRRRGLRGPLVLALIATNGLALIAATQTWVHADVEPTPGLVERVDVAGDTAAPVLAALALAGLALAGALAIAGPVFRRVLGVVTVLLGAAQLVAALGAALDPVGAAESAVTEATGIAGADSVRQIVAAAPLSAWPFVAIACAAAAALAGAAVLVTAGRWPRASRRYETAPAPSAGPADPVDAWDDLSRGDDPTAAAAGGRSPGEEPPGDAAGEPPRDR